MKHQNLYEKGAINSAYITNGEFLAKSERLILLKFIGSRQIVDTAKKILGEDCCFLNSQLFFNPLKGEQKNYWHRDIQYTGLTELEQRQIIEAKQTQVIHLRLALREERGLDFISGSHYRWDLPDELDIRLGRNGKFVFEDMAHSEPQSLAAGDLLIFDANIIHRGLYGGNRFAFDLLFCKRLAHLTQFADEKCFPEESELKEIECPEVFIR